MLLYSVLLLVGFLVLFKSADQFVVGAIATAKILNISPMIIGLTVVALGTSAPEIFVAASASLSGKPELAIGNAIGSNIANIGMVMGITAILVPLPFRPEVLRHDLPMMVFISLCAGLTLIDLRLSLLDGILLLSGLTVFLYRVVKTEKLSRKFASDGNNIDEHEFSPCAEIAEIENTEDMGLPKAMFYLIVSLVFLLLSSELLVYAVIGIAKAHGISELIIGLTVVAVGTSLPELVISVTSALKGETDLAIGNILGSNIFNLLAVLAVPSLMTPTDFAAELLYRDYGLMIGMTLFIALFAYAAKSNPQITRWMGALLLISWAGYLITLYYQSH